MSDIQTAGTLAGAETDTLDEGISGSAELATFDPNTAGKGMDFVEKFQDNAVAIASLKNEALVQLPQMKGSTDYLTAYGNDVLDEVLQSTRRLNSMTGEVALPDDDESALRNLAVQVHSASQWDMQVAANVEKYRAMKKKLTSFMGKGTAKAYFNAFTTDRMSLEKLLDRMRGDLTSRSIHRAQLANAVANQFKVNRDSLDLMKERAAVMQLARQMAVEERAALPATIAHDDPQADKARALEMFIRLISMKIEQYSDRWYVGVALGPVYYSQWEQGVTMAFRLKVMATTGMETVESIIAAYAMSVDIQKDSDTVKVFDNFQNTMTQDMFAHVKDTAIAVARQTATGGLTQQTITSMASSVSSMIEGVQQSYKDAAANQEIKVKAIADGVAVIEKAQNLSPTAQPNDRSQVASVVNTGRTIRSITGITAA